MQEFMYDQSSLLICGVLLAALIACVLLSQRIGRHFAARADAAVQSQVAAIQGSMLGTLALILGFTFSLALQRYDARSEAVVHEANAIGTTYLRVSLLPDSVRDPIRLKLQAYIDVRTRTGETALNDESKLGQLRTQTTTLQAELWTLACQSAREAPSPVTSGLFIQSLNETIDSYSSREAGLARHVPETVLMLLYVTFLMTGSVLGFSAGLSGHRASFATYILVVLILLLVFLIIDLDRPQRGLIEVNQQPMLDLQASVKAQS